MRDPKLTYNMYVCPEDLKLTYNMYVCPEDLKLTYNMYVCPEDPKADIIRMYVRRILKQT